MWVGERDVDGTETQRMREFAPIRSNHVGRGWETRLSAKLRHYLAAGETKTVTFTLTPKELEMLDRNMKWIVEPGWFSVMVGSSSEDIRQQGRFEITSTDQINKPYFSTKTKGMTMDTP